MAADALIAGFARLGDAACPRLLKGHHRPVTVTVAVCDRTKQAIAAKDLTTLTEATEALNRTLNMFRGVVSKTRG